MSPGKSTAKTIKEYVGQLQPWQRTIVAELITLLKKAAPDSKSSIKWRVPTFEQDGILCYIDASNKHVSLGFYKGTLLTDKSNSLEGTGVKLRHVKIRDKKEINKTQFSKWIKEAVKINQSESQAKRK